MARGTLLLLLGGTGIIVHVLANGCHSDVGAVFPHEAVDGVRSESEGAEPARRVVVLPG